MSERHITPELYHLVGSGVLSPRTLARMVHEHVLHHCAECRAAWQALGGDREALTRLLDAETHPAGPALPPLCGTAGPRTPARPSAAGPPAGHQAADRAPAADDGGHYTSAFSRVARRLERQMGDLKRARRQAREDLRELLRLAPEERRRRIVNSRTRFRSRALAELLLEESRSRVRNEPRLAADLAELVPHVLLWTPGALEQEWAAELDAVARGRRANALRVAGDLHAADRELAALRQSAAGRTFSAGAAAELASLEASLRLDQRRFEDADGLLGTAERWARRAGDDEAVARMLIQRGELRRQVGQIPQAARDLDQAMEHLDPRRQTHLFLCAAGTLVLCLCETGEYQEAHQLLRTHEALFAEVMDSWWSLRLRFIEGRVLLGIGDTAGAERLLTETRDGYLDRGASYDAAAASLELALVYLAQGRMQELQRLAADSAPIFRSLAVQRETLAAVRLFQQAVAAESLTSATVHRLREALEQAAATRPTAPPTS